MCIYMCCYISGTTRSTRNHRQQATPTTDGGNRTRAPREGNQSPVRTAVPGKPRPPEPKRPQARRARRAPGSAREPRAARARGSRQGKAGGDQGEGWKRRGQGDETAAAWKRRRHGRRPGRRRHLSNRQAGRQGGEVQRRRRGRHGKSRRQEQRHGVECKEGGGQRSTSWAGTAANDKAGGGHEVNTKRRRGSGLAGRCKQCCQRTV
jgi:hypothetical protein